MINQRTGWHVSVDKIAFNLSFSEGVTLDLDDLAIENPSGFSEESLLEVERVSLRIDIVSLIFQKKIIASNVELDRPVFNLARDQHKQWNVLKLRPSSKDVTAALAPDDTNNGQDKAVAGEGKDGTGPLSQPKEISPAHSTTAPENPSRSLSAPVIRIESFSIKEGLFRYQDHAAQPAVTVPLKDLDVRVTDFSLGSFFPFQIEGSLFSDQKNISVKGNAIINQKSRQIRCDDVRFTTALEDFAYEEMRESLNIEPSLGISGFKNGAGEFFIHQMVFGAEGLLVLSSEGKISNARLDFQQNQYPMNTIDAQFTLTEQNITVSDFVMRMASGEIILKGHVNNYLQTQEYALKLDLKALSAEELFLAYHPAYKFTGWVTGQFQAQGQGLMKSAFIEQLTAEGFVSVEQAVIHDFNLLRMAINKVPDIANLQKRIKENLPERLKKKLAEQDTKFETMYFDLLVRDQSLFLKNTEIETPELSLYVDGHMDPSLRMRISADMVMKKDMSRHLADAVEEFSCLENENDLIYLRFQEYDGPWREVKLLPDVKDLMVRMGKCQLKNQLKKALGGGQQTDTGSSGESILIPIEKGEDIPVDPLIDKAVDIFNDLF